MTSVVHTPLNLPPGPKGHFIFGNLLNLKRDPLGFLTWCAREYGDLARLRFGPFLIYLLNHPDYIEEVLVTKNSLFIRSQVMRSNRLILGNGLLTSEGNFWQRQRRLAQPAFHRERIAAYSQVMVAYTEGMLNTWQDGEIRDVHQEMMRLTLAIVTKTLFDMEMKDQAEAVGAAVTVAMEHFDTRLNTLFLIPDSLPTPGNLRYRRAAQQLNEIVYGIINQRRASGQDSGDLLSMLLHAQDEEGAQMTNQQLRDEVITLFLAGHETTANTLSWTWMLLSQHPEVEAKLTQELQTVLGGRLPTIADLPRLRYTEWVVMESMRLYPTAWSVSREATQDCEIGGYHVRAGTTLFMLQWVMHRDPRFFDNPEVFNPDRWANDLVKRLPAYVYFPFGGGSRVCIGKSFAMMEAILVLAAIAQKFRLTLVQEHPIVIHPSITLRPKYGLKMLLAKQSAKLTIDIAM